MKKNKEKKKVKKILVYAGLLGSIGIGFSLKNCSKASFIENNQIEDELENQEFKPIIKSVVTSDNIEVAINSANLLLENGFMVNEEYFKNICPNIEIDSKYLDKDGYLINISNLNVYKSDKVLENNNYEENILSDKPVIKGSSSSVSDKFVAIQSVNLLINNGYIVSSDYLLNVCPDIEIDSIYFDKDGYLINAISNIEIKGK